MPKFEAHITLPLAARAEVERFAEVTQQWKFSCIDGDALMESKPYCYLTGYDPDGEALLDRAYGAVAALADLGITQLRVKVERIVFDSKTHVDELKNGYS